MPDLIKFCSTSKELALRIAILRSIFAAEKKDVKRKHAPKAALSSLSNTLDQNKIAQQEVNDQDYKEND